MNGILFTCSLTIANAQELESINETQRKTLLNGLNTRG